MENDWRPSITIENLKRRAQLLADVRLFFAERQVLEVDTPTLSTAATTAPYLDSFETVFSPLAGGDEQSYYLHTSPEFAMKRLLAADSGPIYQIAKVFRNGELGKQHSPEFTMLEWYRPGFSLDELMDEVSNLLHTAAGLTKPVRYSYAEVFSTYLNIDVFQCSEQTLKQLALANIASLDADLALDRDGWCELLMSEVIEPQLASTAQAVFIDQFPASQAQLAKVIKDEQGRDVAARFELYAGGLEVANGYDELLDADELRSRFELDNQQRKQLGKPSMPIDESLLAAMVSGLPTCSGVALGLDRLLMVMLAASEINEVQTFRY